MREQNREDLDPTKQQRRIDDLFLCCFSLTHEVLHDSGDVLLECVHLVSLVILFQVLDYLLHVVLEVDGEILLGAKSGFHQTMVQDDIDAGDGSLFAALVGFLSGGIGALKHDLAFLARLVLEKNIVNKIIRRC